jgi:hypothetical protein
VEILDAAGKVIRTLRGPNSAGVNRLAWDLRDEPSMEVRLLTSPLYAEHIVAGPQGRTAPGTSRLSILMPPGSYAVRLTVDGASQTQPLEVRKDPNSGGSEAEIAAQVKVLAGIKQQLNDAGSAVHRVESVRLQLQQVQRLSTDAEVVRAIRALDAKLIDVEMKLVDLRQTGQGQDGVRFGSMLISKMGYLANGMSSSDFTPTTQHVEVDGILREQLKQHLAAIDGVLSSELAPLNGQLDAKGLPKVVDRAGPAARIVP